MVDALDCFESFVSFLLSPLIVILWHKTKRTSWLSSTKQNNKYTSFLNHKKIITETYIIQTYTVSFSWVVVKDSPYFWFLLKILKQHFICRIMFRLSIKGGTVATALSIQYKYRDIFKMMIVIYLNIFKKYIIFILFIYFYKTLKHIIN